MRLRTFFATGFLAVLMAASLHAAPVRVVVHPVHVTPVAVAVHPVHVATIPARRADRIALGVVPNGQVRSTVLQRSGRQLTYVVNLSTPRRGMMRVDIDARTGAVLSTHRASVGGYHRHHA